MFIVDMKVIFRWVQNCHHESGFLSVHQYLYAGRTEGKSHHVKSLNPPNFFYWGGNRSIYKFKSLNGPAPSKDMQIPSPLSLRFDPIFMEDAQCAETNEKPISRFFIFRVIVQKFHRKLK